MRAGAPEPLGEDRLSALKFVTADRPTETTRGVAVPRCTPIRCTSLQSGWLFSCARQRHPALAQAERHLVSTPILSPAVLRVGTPDACCSALDAQTGARSGVPRPRARSINAVVSGDSIIFPTRPIRSSRSRDHGKFKCSTRRDAREYTRAGHAGV